ncbi:beta-ketoacyl synthase chain length factor [Flammeovirgaceae bacterium SG7u.111]|nr:beta-ketoacyl synthase chain length factor [Flammeovirgaceae bacterium SG7u.132]WPO36158.1 beta-ketoacyl synthase chain length factor [Flammeovirgaceae bacterium SG7u.111]
MNVFINGTSAISSQATFDGNQYLSEWVSPENEYFKCLEPTYKEVINARLLRRMSRIIKMGVATSLKSLEEAEVEDPSAILVGTGLGCLADTEKFLDAFSTNDGGLLSPTPFIQSTHNTIAGQVSLLLKSHSYAFTYSQRGHSFENALEDAIAKTSEANAQVLVGGLDEIIPTSLSILNKLACTPASAKAPFWGEGSAFFILSNQASASSYAQISAFETLYNPESDEEVKAWISSSLEKAEITPSGLDAVVTGADKKLSEELFGEIALVSFKNISGEYFTASALGLNLGANMVKNQQVFQKTLILGDGPSKIDNLLIYNNFNNKYHSLILLKKC